MSDLKHTPGPWELVRTEKGELELGGSLEQSTGVYSSAGFGLVANVIYKKTNILGDSKVLQKQTFEANAALIAASPDNYQANYDFVDNLTIWIEEGRFRLWPESDLNLLKELINQGEEAIKKAKP